MPTLPAQLLCSTCQKTIILRDDEFNPTHVTPESATSSEAWLVDVQCPNCGSTVSETFVECSNCGRLTNVRDAKRATSTVLYCQGCARGFGSKKSAGNLK